MKKYSGWALLALLGVCGVSGCGGAAKPAESPAAEPSDAALLEDEPGAAAAASSAEVQQGIDAINAEDFQRAKQLLAPAVAAAPKDAQAVFYLGVAESALGETDAAVQHLKTALELDPKLTEASLNLSALLLDAGSHAEALEAADQGLKAAPADVGLLQNKALALSGLGRPAEAAELYAKVLEQRGADEGLRFMYAEALLAAKQPDVAATQLEKLTASDNQEVLASVADLLGRLKRWDGCISALDRAIGKGEASELFVKRGLCRHGKEDEAGAKTDFEKAIALDPKSAKAYFYLGHNLTARGDKKGAKKAFAKVIELDPTGPFGKAAKAIK